jgi:hypothetical protein
MKGAGHTMADQTSPGYMLLDGDSGSLFCELDFIENFEDTHKLYKGWPLAGEWPGNVLFRMDPTSKKQIKLSDHLVNHNNVIVASSKLQQFVLGSGVPNIEILPIKIIDHKKRVASKEYAIIHLVTTQDCINTKISKVTWNDINPEQVLSMERLVIDEEKVDKKSVLFRAKGLVNQIFVRRDFANKLQEGGYTGLRFWELSDYAG